MGGRRGWGRRTVATTLAVLCVSTAACSGESRTDAAGPVPADATRDDTAGSAEAPGPVDPSVATGEDGASDPGASSAAPARGAAGASPKSVRETATATEPAARADRSLVPPFAPADERIGITDTSIKLCTHINGQASAAIGGSQEDARVFWRWLNDRGGVHGRKVDMVIADDGDGTTVASAYEECRGSFLIVGGPTQEAVPAFREIVENDPHPAPYLHFMARSDPTKRYSFSWYPTQERYGVLAAQFILSRHPGKRIGVIRRDTDNWSPGFHSFVAELKRRGVEPVVALAHPPREQIFEPYLAELAAKKADVVWAWNHGVEHIPMLKQANARRYRFNWVLGFPLSVVSETVREELLEPRVTGLSVFSTFRAGLYDEHHARYRQEGPIFEAAFEKYRGRPVDAVFGDLLFRQWMDGRQLAALLERCGRDCTRTKAVTVLVDDLSHRPPSCPFDFSLGRAAGDSLSSVEAYAPNASTVAWRETAHCVSSF